MCTAIGLAGGMAAEGVPAEGAHEIRVSISDGLPLSITSFLGMGLADIFVGARRTDSQSSGVMSVGYRYVTSRIRAGIDLSVIGISSKLVYDDEVEPSAKEHVTYFMVLPTAEFTYYRHAAIEVYGTAAVGVNLSHKGYKGMNGGGERVAAQDDAYLSSDFAFQINPIGLRLGSARIAGFIEAGLGYKGFVTVGTSYRF